MPYVSSAQRKFAHTSTARAAGFPTAEFDAASKGMRGLPEHANQRTFKKPGPPKFRPELGKKPRRAAYRKDDVGDHEFR